MHAIMYNHYKSSSLGPQMDHMGWLSTTTCVQLLGPFILACL